MVDTPGGHGAFHKLAPYLKLSYEQLIQSGINPGYPGLIPAYDVAVALAYVISNAPSYHNQTVMVSDVMDKMALAVNYDAENVGDANLNEYQEKQFAHLSLISEPLAKLQEWIIATDDEFDRLPFFARPLARTGFRRKVGISIGDCKELLGLAIGSQSSQDGPVTDISTFGQNDVSASGYALVNAGPNLPTGMIASRLRSILPGLITYYHEVPKETARFVRDPELLKQITQVAQERAETCGALAKVLDHNIS